MTTGADVRAITDLHVRAIIRVWRGVRLGKDKICKQIVEVIVGGHLERRGEGQEDSVRIPWENSVRKPWEDSIRTQREDSIRTPRDVSVRTPLEVSVRTPCGDIRRVINNK